jgi:hypothetical protein
MLMKTQSSTVPAFGLSVGGGFSKSRPWRFKVQSAVAGATALGGLKPLLCGAGSLARRPGRLAGTAAGPGWMTMVPTRICMTAVNGGAGVLRGSRGVVLVT